jgi:hypothetical protein
MTGAQLKEACVPRTLLLAEEIGRTARETRAAHGDVVGAIVEKLNGDRLFGGKIVDIARRTDAGFAKAEAVIEGTGRDAGATLRLSVQNEHLVASRDGDLVATVPDLIIMLDSESGEPITTEEMRYGFRVTVIAAPCDPRWRSSARATSATTWSTFRSSSVGLRASGGRSALPLAEPGSRAVG